MVGNEARQRSPQTRTVIAGRAYEQEQHAASKVVEGAKRRIGPYKALARLKLIERPRSASPELPPPVVVRGALDVRTPCSPEFCLLEGGNKLGRVPSDELNIGG